MARSETHYITQIPTFPLPSTNEKITVQISLSKHTAFATKSASNRLTEDTSNHIIDKSMCMRDENSLNVEDALSVKNHEFEPP